MLTIKMDVGGVTRSMQLLADSLTSAKLKKPLDEISKAKQDEVRQRFQQNGPGWAPRAPSTIQQDIGRVRARVAVSQERSGHVIAQRLFAQFKLAVKRGAKASTLDKRRMEIAVLRELRGGDVSTLDTRIRGAYDAASGKAREQARQRIFRRALAAKESIRAGHMLGRIANSIKAKVENNTLSLASEIAWSGVHNDGGTAGRGVRIPERKFLEWTENDYRTACEAFERHMLKSIG